MFLMIVVTSFSGSSSSWTLRPGRWRYYCPLKCHKLLTQPHIT